MTHELELTGLGMARVAVNALTADNKELRAEIERLKEVVTRLHGEKRNQKAEIERLTAENARLKEIETKYDQFISGAFI